MTEEKCPRCGSADTTAHVQSVISNSTTTVHSVGWRCLKCQHIWGHEGFAKEALGY